MFRVQEKCEEGIIPGNKSWDNQQQEGEGKMALGQSLKKYISGKKKI